MKIPEYDQNVSLSPPGPTPSISGEQAAAPWLGLAKVAGEAYKLERVIQEKQNEIYRVKDVSDRTVQAEAETSDLMLALEQERDPQTAEEKFRDGYADIKNRVLEGVNDYKVATALTSHLASREAQYSTTVKHTARKWTLENDQQDMMTTNDDWKRIATNDPTQVDYAADMIRARVGASVRSGSILPSTGKTFSDKEVKDLYTQVMSQMILNDPKSAPDLIKPLLLKSGLDPQDQWAMEERAERARASFEIRGAKGDKVLWDANAARASIQIRKGELGEAGITALFESSQIGPDQLHYLHSVLDSTTVRSDSMNAKTSNHAVNGILNDVMFNRLTPEAAARKIDQNSSILPEHKTSAMQLLIGIGKKVDSIPPQFEKAMQIYRTTVAPSSFSLNPKAEEMDAWGSVQREVWSDYLANEKKYQADPNLLIKRAIDKTKPGIAPVDIIGPSPYPDKKSLLEAYNYYVLGKVDDYKPGPGRMMVKRTSRAQWEKWFRQMGEEMPPWPK